MLTIQQSPESEIGIIDAKEFFGFDYKEYPGIENIATVKKYKKGEMQFQYDETILSPEGIVADSTLFEIFDFKLKSGNIKTVLHEPDAIVISEKLANQLFGNEEPLGKMVKVNSRNEMFYTVKAITETTPSNSSITFDFIIPSHSGGYNRSGGNFIMVNSNFNKTDFVNKIKDLGHKHEQFTDSHMDVIALNDVYFNESGNNFKGIFSKFGNTKNIRILFAIILVVFIITMLNFSNLQIININSSIKNVGINKISGARITQILFQKVTELFVLIFFSALLVSATFIIVLPYFNRLVGVELSPDFGQVFLLSLITLVLLITSAMIYPVIVINRISATNSLKNQILPGNRLAGRNIVATAQFTLSLILLIASIVVVKQLNLMLNQDLGFSSGNIIRAQLVHKTVFKETQEERMTEKQKQLENYEYVKNELTAQSFINNYSQGQSPLNPFTMPWKVNDGVKDYTTVNGLSVTPEYLKLFELTITEGRFFERERDKSRGNQVVINEAAKKFWNIEDISQSKILNKYWSIRDNKDGFEIIGVIKDFNSEHLSVKPQPLVMVYFDDIEAEFFIQFEEGASQQGIQFVQNLFNKVNTGESFSYTFLSDDIEAMYQKEKRLSEIYILFTIIAFAISSIGLFAISLYDTRRRTKEIGIRKVNGATVSEILTMLNKDFVKWVTIAFVIATPIAYYAMHKWLENFAYKTELSWWIFALAGLLALGIALLTVSWQSWRAATRNPVEALRYE
jgi:putative ABC transport system permease protein